MVNAIPATIKVMMPLAIGSAMPADPGVEMWLRSLAFLLGIAVALKHLLAKKTAVPNPCATCTTALTRLPSPPAAPTPNSPRLRKTPTSSSQNSSNR